MVVSYGGGVTGRLIETSPDFAVREDVELYVDDDAIDAQVTINARYSPDRGRYFAERVSVTGRERDDDAGTEEVTGAMLRDVRVQDYLRGGLAAMGVVEYRSGEPFELDAAIARRLEIVSAGPSDPTTLLWVARIYRAAEIVNARPAKAVQDALGLTQPTATVWIRRARDRRLMFPFGFEQWDRPHG